MGSLPLLMLDPVWLLWNGRAKEPRPPNRASVCYSGDSLSTLASSSGSTRVLPPVDGGSLAGNVSSTDRSTFSSDLSLLGNCSFGVVVMIASSAITRYCVKSACAAGLFEGQLIARPSTLSVRQG